MNHSSPYMFPVVDPLRHPKSPTGIENPLLKANAQFATKTLLLTTSKQRPATQFSQPLKSVTNTPGPPPKTSLSLNMKLKAVQQLESSSYETPVNSAPAISLTNGSPLPFFTLQDETPKQPTLAGGCWVMAYGSTNERERQSLLSILRASGPILSTKSHSNWIAVQYPDEICVARATARQIIPVGSVLCGISHVTVSFLGDVLARMALPFESTTLVEASLPKGSDTLLKSTSLVEEDILAKYNESHAHSEAQGSPAVERDTSLLVKAVYYFMGWQSP